MSLFHRRDWAGLKIMEAHPERFGGAGSVVVDGDTSLDHSAVWAARRLRGDMVSTTPLDVFRRVDGVQIEMPKPPVLVQPGGPTVDLCEWLYSSQGDLDTYGNAVGLISQRDGNGLPARIDLWSADSWTVLGKGQEITGFRHRGEVYDPRDVWHEKQFTASGCPVGLSVLAHARASIGHYLSAQQFALDWFANGVSPMGHLKNTKDDLDSKAADVAKARFKSSIQGRDVFVSGANWEWQPLESAAEDAGWVESMQFGITDVARFFGVPADMIDGATPSSNITYANVTQRNLQFLVLNLGPAFVRRERALSKLTASPRYVKFNTKALLRLDPQTQAEIDNAAIAARRLAPSETREHDNLPPFTEEQMAEFDRLFGKPAQTPQKGVA